jgi:putative ABC transport system substrate-binding protein
MNGSAIVRRRHFLTLAGAAAAWPRVAFTQQPAKIPRVAYGDGGTPVENIVPNSTHPFVRPFFQEMARLGFEYGRTVIFDRYFATPSNAEETARAMVDSKPDLIFLRGAGLTTFAVMALTKTIPIVVHGGDPLGQGIVNNLARPGGNVTAVAGGGVAGDFEGKVLAILAEAVPGARRVAYIGVGVGTSNQFAPNNALGVRSATDAAAKLGLDITTIAARDPADERAFRDAMAVAAAAKAEMVQFASHAQIGPNSPILVRLTLEARLPAIAVVEDFPYAGGLLSFGSSRADGARKAAGYVALILNGAKPGDLPVIVPDVFELIVNLKTAKAIGISIPQSVLLQATQVIE